jgi:hypothetical protein
LSESNLSLFDLLLLPITGPAKGLLFVLEQIRDTVDRELYNPEVLEQQLMEARMLYELGEMEVGDYERLEAQIVSRLTEIRRQREGR